MALAVGVLLASCGSPPATTAPPAGLARACVGRRTPPPRYQHVIWIWFENRSYDSVIDRSRTPYTTALASACGLARNFHSITRPSLPNYVAATSGLRLEALRSFGSDCDPSPRCSTGARSLFAQVASWRAYQEGMPAPCARRDRGRYAVRHNPPPYYRGLSGCARFDVPYAQLEQDLRAQALPAFSFVTPDLCSDTHDCDVAAGDAWLREALPVITASSEYRAGRTAVFITWDEGEGPWDEARGGGTERCAAKPDDRGCHVAAVVVSPYTRRIASDVLFDHYSLLRTTEEMLGVPPLRQAAQARSMRGAFRL